MEIDDFNNLLGLGNVVGFSLKTIHGKSYINVYVLIPKF